MARTILSTLITHELIEISGRFFAGSSSLKIDLSLFIKVKNPVLPHGALEIKF